MAIVKYIVMRKLWCGNTRKYELMIDNFVKATAQAEREFPMNMKRIQCLTVGSIVAKLRFQTCCPRPNCVAIAQCQGQIESHRDGDGGGKHHTSKYYSAKYQCK